VTGASMVSFRELVNAFRELGLDGKQPVIVHSALSAVGEIRGGTETVIGALSSTARGILVPTFTYKTKIIPEAGPPDNALVYGSGKDLNRMAEFFTPDMPADSLMGVLPEAIRTSPNARRSSHPILSFAGIGLDSALEAQTIEEPLAPIRVLAEEGGVVLLIGVDHTVNTSIHYAEKMAGRRQFTRWALTPQGVRQCPGFPGCSDGFEQAVPYLNAITRTARAGSATLRAIPVAPMIMTLTDLVRSQPQALLCHKIDCQRCETTRRCPQADILQEK
jgi:aminoglycoside 3-N-acetyltransferase